MRFLLRQTTVLVAAFVFTGFSVTGYAGDFATEDGASSLRVMFYNVYNLFDDEHDEGKEDWEFLSKDFPGKSEGCDRNSVPRFRKSCHDTDWTRQHMELKIDQVARAIESTGRYLPDILGVVEVENENVVGMLADRLGYNSYWVTNSPDRRGIDVAILARTSDRVQYLRHQEFKVDFGDTSKKRTRNILGVEFLVDDRKSLITFVNHWPSPGNPTSSRLAAAGTLNKAIASFRKDSPKAAVIAGGDFNSIEGEKPSPITSILTDQHNPYRLFDMHSAYHQDDRIPTESKSDQPEGTYFYPRNRQWNVLDRILVCEGLMKKTSLTAEVTSYKIHANDLLSREWIENIHRLTADSAMMVPWRYNNRTLNPDKAGFSDHYPVSVELRIK